MITGVLMIASSLLLLLYNRNEDSSAGQAAVAALDDVKAAISGRIGDRSYGQEHQPVTGYSGLLTEEDIEGAEYFAEGSEEFSDTIQSDAETISQQELSDNKMTYTEINGYDFIGYLSIPVLKLELPIMSDWDFERLKIAPCRQFGSTGGGNLVIAGHNYTRHFGYLQKLKTGDLVLFADMEGVMNTYEVKAVEVLQPSAVDEVKNSIWDLTLYTCTYGGKSRVAVFCNYFKQTT